MNFVFNEYRELFYTHTPFLGIPLKPNPFSLLGDVLFKTKIFMPSQIKLQTAFILVLGFGSPFLKVLQMPVSAAKTALYILSLAFQGRIEFHRPQWFCWRDHLESCVEQTRAASGGWGCCFSSRSSTAAPLLCPPVPGSQQPRLYPLGGDQWRATWHSRALAGICRAMALTPLL